MKLGLLESQSRMPRQSLNSQRVPAELGLLGGPMKSPPRKRWNVRCEPKKLSGLRRSERGACFHPVCFGSFDVREISMRWFDSLHASGRCRHLWYFFSRWSFVACVFYFSTWKQTNKEKQIYRERNEYMDPKTNTLIQEKKFVFNYTYHDSTNPWCVQNVVLLFFCVVFPICISPCVSLLSLSFVFVFSYFGSDSFVYWCIYLFSIHLCVCFAKKRRDGVSDKLSFSKNVS